MSKLLSATQAAKELGISARVVLKAIDRGTLKAVKLGSSTSPWVITYDDLTKWHNNKPRYPLPDCEELQVLSSELTQVQIARKFRVSKQAVSEKLKNCKERQDDQKSYDDN